MTFNDEGAALRRAYNKVALRILVGLALTVVCGAFVGHMLSVFNQPKYPGQAWLALFFAVAGCLAYIRLIIQLFITKERHIEQDGE